VGKRRRRKAPEAAGAGTEPAVQPTEHPKRSNVVRDLVVGIGIAVLIALVKTIVEPTLFGRDIDLVGYQYVQRALRLFRGDSDRQPIKVAVLDISELQTAPHEVYGANKPITPRDKLTDVVHALLDAHPLAIGIDINFAPYESDDFLSPSDKLFFDDCLEIWETHGIPVVVGLNWSDAGEDWRRPETLIENRRYHKLLGWIHVSNSTRTIPASISDGDWKLPSLSWALATQALGASDPRSSGSWFAEPLSKRRLRSATIESFPVDYSPLVQLRKSKHKAIDPVAIRAMRDEFVSKIVLVGNASGARDTFLVPPEIEPVAGVYLHACAANTIATSPMYELTHLGRFVIDVAIVIIALVTVLALKWGYSGAKSRRGSSVPAARMVAADRVFRFLTAVGLISVCVWLVFYWRVLWSDFLLVGIFIAFHKQIEHVLVRAWGGSAPPGG